MAQLEELGEFEKFHLAQMSALTDMSRYPNVSVQEQTSGTERRWLVPGRNLTPPYYQPTDPIPVGLGADLAITMLRTMSQFMSEDTATWIGPPEPSRTSAAADPKVGTTAAINLARAHHLNDVADRLALLFEQELDEDEEPLNVEAAKNFVVYCVARDKKARPLMTATPLGDLDILWKWPGRDAISMRFFGDGVVWIVYKVSDYRVTCETDVGGLLSSDLPIDLPAWA